MFFFLLIGFIVIYILSPLFRCAVSHPISVISNGVVDAYYYISQHGYNNAPFGQISCYIADGSTSFGCGKTLSATDYLVSLYHRYDGKTVWCPERKKMVTQRIKILSNVDFLTIPYERLISLAQFVQWADDVREVDFQNDTYTVTYMFIDEASSQLNSRAFKNNFDAYFISRLLTTRHARASIILTSQRSAMVDKLMRDCTNLYIGCHKIWRFQMLNFYDAYEIENAQSPALVAPLRRTCWFVQNSAFDNYDTFASVQSLKKSCKEGDMLTEAEIVALQVAQPANMENVNRPSRRWLRSRRRANK